MNHLAASGQPGVAENYCSVGANQMFPWLASTPKSIVHGTKLVSRGSMAQDDVRPGVG